MTTVLQQRRIPEAIRALSTIENPDYAGARIRMEARSWMVTAEAVFQLDEERVNFSLFARYEHPVASVIGPAVTFAHRRGTPGLLRHAVRKLA